MRHLVPLMLLGLLLILGLPGFDAALVQAQSTEPHRAFVYGINAATPDSYVGTFAPPSAETIYLLADRPSVISPRITEIYFWPITNEYRASWSRLNESVPGVLEISRGGETVAAIEATDYTIQHRTDKDNTTTEIFFGEDAIAAHGRFQARQEAFRQDSAAYYDAQRAWMDAIADANARRQAGEDIELPPEPQPPAPIGIFSNGLNQGYPVNLAPGSYRIRLRGADGETVADSQRALVVFAPRSTGVGYAIVPESRWTTPDQSNAPSDVIFGAANTNLYLEPHLTWEYPAQEWARLQNPQRAAATAGEWEWVTGRLITDGELEIRSGDGAVHREELTPYKVDQVPGAQLGYEVLELAGNDGDDSTSPNFEAFPLHLATAGEGYQIRLLSETDEVMPGSVRSVRVPAGNSVTRLLVMPAVPLLLGAVLITWRQRRTKPTAPLSES